MFLLLVFWAVATAKAIPQAFIPHEDQGTVMVDANLPEGCVRSLTAQACGEAVTRMRVLARVVRGVKAYGEPPPSPPASLLAWCPFVSSGVEARLLRAHPGKGEERRPMLHLCQGSWKCPTL